MSPSSDIVPALLSAAGLSRDLAVLRIDHGMSGDLVFRIESAPPLFAKIGDPARRISRREMTREIAAIDWLQGKAAAARLVWAGDVDGRQAMVTEALAGAPLHDLSADAAADGVVAALDALARLHALPIASCPFDERLDVKLAEARLRVRLGEVEIERLEPQNVATSPEGLLEALEAARPASEDLVVTHGDASWPNFIVGPNGEAAVIDLGRFGVADRHQDLALFVRSARYNVPQLDIERLLARHYPVAASTEKLAYYRQLDELY